MDTIQSNFITAFDAICKRDNIKARELCKRIEANETVISALRKKKGNIKGGYLAALVKQGVSPNFLLTGHGEVFGDKLDTIINILTGLRNLNEQALVPLIDGYIEIKISENMGPIKNIGKS